MTREPTAMVAADDVMRVLEGTIDPEINISILDLRMVRSVKVEGNTVCVDIARTIADCPLTGRIRDDVARAVSRS